MGLAAILARRSLLQRPGRTLFSILGIAVGIATVVGIFTLDHNTLILRAHSDDPDWQAEIQVSPSEGVKNPREELRHVVGVSDVSSVFQSQASLWPDGGEPRGTYFVGLEPAHARALGKYSLLEGRDLEPGRAELLVGENLALELGLGLGARVGLSAPRVVPAEECVGGKLVQKELESKDPPRREFEVVGILARDGIGRRASGQVVVADVDVAAPLFADGRVQKRFWVRRDPKINLETLQANLGEAWSYDLKKSVIIGQAADERAFRNGVRFAGLALAASKPYFAFRGALYTGPFFATDQSVPSLIASRKDAPELLYGAAGAASAQAFDLVASGSSLTATVAIAGAGPIVVVVLSAGKPRDAVVV